MACKRRERKNIFTFIQIAQKKEEKTICRISCSEFMHVNDVPHGCVKLSNQPDWGVSFSRGGIFFTTTF